MLLKPCKENIELFLPKEQLISFSSSSVGVMIYDRSQGAMHSIQTQKVLEIWGTQQTTESIWKVNTRNCAVLTTAGL